MTSPYQRSLNSSAPKIDKPNIARDGSVPKNIVDAPIHPNAVRQTQGVPAAFHMGVTVDDTPNSAIVKDHEKAIGFHSGMTDKQIIKFANDSSARETLEDAARLGKPPEKA